MGTARLLTIDPACPETPAYRQALAIAAGILAAGGLVGFPTDTVYGLAADALSPAAVARVYRSKQRPANQPLILLLAESGEAPAYVTGIDRLTRQLMDEFWPGQLTLVLNRTPIVPDITAGGRGSIGLRVPGHPVARDLVRALGRPVVGPSANRSGRPSPTCAADVLAELGGDIDAVLDGGPASLGVESTVLDLTVRPPVVLRVGAVSVGRLQRTAGELVVPTGARAGSGKMGPRLVVLDVVAGGGDPAAALWLAADELAERGLHVGVLAPADAAGGSPGHPATAAAGLVWLRLGIAGDAESIAGGLYPALRQAEFAGCDVVVAATMSGSGLIAAVNGRLLSLADEVRGR